MKEWLFLSGILGFAFLLTATSWDYPFVTALYPRMLLACAFFLCGLKILFLLKKPGAKKASIGEETPGNLKNFWIYLGGAILYVIIMPQLGFILSTFLILALLLGFFGVKLKTSLAIGGITGLVCYGIFVIALEIPLPKGMIENIIAPIFRS